eukprot:1161345-Pelagomonas_calceolata.AAC.4
MARHGAWGCFAPPQTVYYASPPAQSRCLHMQLHLVARQRLCRECLTPCLNGCASRICACVRAESLYGMCESMWRPDMEPEELFETLSQCLLSGVDRDALAGWGAMVHVITKDKVISRTLKGRMD